MKRLFIDSSALFAAIYSTKGYAHDLILMGIDQKVTLVISSFVMEETRRNLAGSAPETLPALERVFELVPFEIANPPKEMIMHAAGQTVLKDAPILAAAKSASVDILVTLDKRHLLGRPELEQYIEGKILRPQEAFEQLFDK